MSTVRIVRPIGTDLGSVMQGAVQQIGEVMDPAREARAMALASNAGLDRARTADVQAQMDGRAMLAEALRRGERPSPELYALAAGAGADFFRSMPQTVRGYAAVVPGMTLEGMAPYQLGAGDGYRETVPGFREGLTNQLAQSRIAAGPGYARVAEERRQFDETGITMIGPDGRAVLVPRRDTGRAGYRPPLTATQVEAQAREELLRGVGVPIGTTPQVAAAAPSAAQRSADDALAEIQRNQRLATTEAGRNERLGVTEAGRNDRANSRPLAASATRTVQRMLEDRADSLGISRSHPSFAEVLAETETLMREGRAPAEAFNEVMNRYEAAGTYNPFSTNRFVRRPDAAPAAPGGRGGYEPPRATQPPPGGARPDPQPQAPVDAVPPAPAQRERGRVYQTPRGPMVWTGTGWVPAQ